MFWSGSKRPLYDILKRKFYYFFQYRIHPRQRLNRISQKPFVLIYANMPANQLHSWQGNHEMVHNTALSKPKTCCSPLLCHHLELCSLEACLQMASFPPAGCSRIWLERWELLISCGTPPFFIQPRIPPVSYFTRCMHSRDPLRLIHLFPFLSSKLNDFDLFRSLNVGSPKNSKVTLAQVYVDLCCGMIINDHYFVLNCNVYLGIFW